MPNIATNIAAIGYISFIKHLFCVVGLLGEDGQDPVEHHRSYVYIEKLDNLVDESDPCHMYVSHVYVALGRYCISSQTIDVKSSLNMSTVVVNVDIV